MERADRVGVNHGNTLHSRRSTHNRWVQARLPWSKGEIMEWLKDLKKEELPENYQEMLGVLTEALCDEQLALRALIAQAKYYNKQPFYYSGIDAIVTRKKREYIIKNRGRMKVSDLARITEWAQRTIYDIFEELQASKQKDLFKEGGDEAGAAPCTRAGHS